MEGFKSVGGMATFWINIFLLENDVLFGKDTGKLGKRNSNCSNQESNLHVRPSDY